MKLTAILIIVLIISLGVFSVNQSLNYFYKSKFLQSPCKLCEELNPHLKSCFKGESLLDPLKEREEGMKELNYSFSNLKTGNI